MPKPQPHTRSASIEISCTPQEKEQLRERATRAGTTVSKYLLTLGLDGNTTEYGTLRRKADAPLANAQLYKRLGELIEVLNLYPSLDGIEEVVELVHTLRREIALRRLSHRVEEVVNDL